LRTGCSVLRIAEGRHGVEVDALHHASGQVERWQAALRRGAAGVRGGTWCSPHRLPAGRRPAPAMGPWLVANIHLDAPLQDRPGAAPAWDNVLYQDANPGGLGYVDATTSA
jgi:hypothetical protein